MNADWPIRWQYFDHVTSPAQLKLRTRIEDWHFGVSWLLCEQKIPCFCFTFRFFSWTIHFNFYILPKMSAALITLGLALKAQIRNKPDWMIIELSSWFWLNVYPIWNDKKHWFFIFFTVTIFFIDRMSLLWLFHPITALL